MTSSEGPLLQMQGICKAFAGVQALRGVDFSVERGEVHGLVGENGAGKSTLMRILSGAVAPDAGRILLSGSPVEFASPASSQRAGVAMIHQELSLAPPLSVAANIFLGQEPTGPGGLLRERHTRERAAALMADLATPLDVGLRAERLPISVQQMVEVAKALARDARLIVMDEPTSALSEAEVRRLFDVIRSLRDRGVGVVYISHKMDEIYALCERITVLRDGELVGVAAAAELPPGKLIEWMVGRTIDQLFPKEPVAPGAEVLRVEGLTLEGAGSRPVLDGVCLSVRAGEIVGLAGLRGAGASELMGCLFGAYGKRAQMRVFLSGAEAQLTSPAAAIRQGIAMLTNDRKVSGLVLSMSVLHNITLAALACVSSGGLVNARAERAAGERMVEALDIRAASHRAEVAALSGGNQQKVALAKWLLTEPRCLLLDEPTRGVDVGAKTEIYRLMSRLAAEGKGIVLTTSELPELLAMSDRILVLHRGRLVAEMTRDEATQEKVMAAATGSEVHG